MVKLLVGLYLLSGATAQPMGIIEVPHDFHDIESCDAYAAEIRHQTVPGFIWQYECVEEQDA